VFFFPQGARGRAQGVWLRDEIASYLAMTGGWKEP